MRNPNGRLLLLIEIIFVLFLFFLMVLPRSQSFSGFQSDLSENYNYCYTDKDAVVHKKTKDCQGFLYKMFDDPVALFTGFSVLATVALFVVTYWLFKTASQEGAKTEEALRIARDSALAAQTSANAAIAADRAYIEAIDFKVLSYFFETDIPIGEEIVVVEIPVSFTLKNFGKTPGLITNFSLDATAGTFAYAEFGAWMPRFDVNGIVLGEKESHVVDEQIVVLPTTGLQIARFIRGVERLHIRIIIEYAHVFDARPLPSMNYWQYINRSGERHWVRHQNEGVS